MTFGGFGANGMIFAMSGNSFGRFDTHLTHLQRFITFLLIFLLVYVIINLIYIQINKHTKIFLIQYIYLIL